MRWHVAMLSILAFTTQYPIRGMAIYVWTYAILGFYAKWMDPDG